MTIKLTLNTDIPTCVDHKIFTFSWMVSVSSISEWFNRTSSRTLNFNLVTLSPVNSFTIAVHHHNNQTTVKMRERKNITFPFVWLQIQLMTPNFDSSMGCKSWSSCCWRYFSSSREKNAQLICCLSISYRVGCVFSHMTWMAERECFGRKQYSYIYFFFGWSLFDQSIIFESFEVGRVKKKCVRAVIEWDLSEMKFVCRSFLSSLLIFIFIQLRQ